MSDLEHPGERRPVDLVLFGVAFVALIFSLAGVELSSPGLALGGGFVALGSISVFLLRSML